MTKFDMYRYLGTNGTIDSPIFLDGVYCVKLVKMIADSGHLLTNGSLKVRSIVVPVSEVETWSEVEE